MSEEKLRIFDDAVPIVRDVVDRHGGRKIVDLCSGGGGPLLSILEKIDADAVLTDLYPNVQAFKQSEQRFPERVRGWRAPVDATNVPDELEGVRTLFNAFHHFRPALAKKILEDAARKKRPLVILEVVERHPLTMAVIACVPLAVLALTPFTKPPLLRLLLTYVLPLLPLATGWDGLASCARAYSIAELQALADSVVVDGYAFRVGHTARGLVPMRVTYLVGEPA